MFLVCTPTQLVDTGLLDLPGTGAAKDEMKVILDHQLVNDIQQLRKFLDLIYNDQGLGRIFHQHLVELHGTTPESFSRIRIKKVNVYGLWESLPQKRRFPNLTAAKQEHALIQAVLYVEYSMIHNHREILQHL